MSEPYPSDWDSLRKKVYKRDDYQCQNCGRRGGPYGDSELHAHHVVALSDGGSNELSNLTTLCKGCHDSIHTSAMAPTAEDSTTVPDDLLSAPRIVVVPVTFALMWAILTIPSIAVFTVILNLPEMVSVIISFGITLYGVAADFEDDEYA